MTSDRRTRRRAGGFAAGFGGSSSGASSAGAGAFFACGVRALDGRYRNGIKGKRTNFAGGAALGGSTLTQSSSSVGASAGAFFA